MSIILYTDWINVKRYKKGEEWLAFTRPLNDFNLQVVVQPEEVVKNHKDICYMAGREI